jgi:hypothetical protein
MNHREILETKNGTREIHVHMMEESGVGGGIVQEHRDR